MCNSGIERGFIIRGEFWGKGWRVEGPVEGFLFPRRLIQAIEECVDEMSSRVSGSVNWGAARIWLRRAISYFELNETDEISAESRVALPMVYPCQMVIGDQVCWLPSRYTIGLHIQLQGFEEWEGLHLLWVCRCLQRIMLWVEERLESLGFLFPLHKL